MKIERYQPRKQGTSPILLGCGCLGVGAIGIAITAIVAMTFFPMLPSLILPNFGLEAIGNTSEVLNAPVSTLQPLMDVQTVGSVILETGSYSQTFSGTGAGYTVVIGDTESDMQQQMQVSFTESGLVEQCRELVTICSQLSDSGMRNTRFDLRAGGMVINTDFEIQAGVWQSVGLVVQINNNQMDIVGVDIGGTVFAPTTTDLSALVSEAESRGNLFLRELSARTGIDTFNLANIIIDDTTMTLILR